mmetsp:Transcript_19002/g.35435  ORF Transcript_19002/g.35435 Transcript_19002/m.35435 type:complete len:103 (+) Transcript_19002:907-1215(+)
MHRRHSYEEHNDMPIELQTFRMGPRFRPEFQRMTDAMSLQCYQMLSIIGAPFVIKKCLKVTFSFEFECALWTRCSGNQAPDNVVRNSSREINDVASALLNDN